MKRMVIPSHMTEQALKDLDIRTMLNVIYSVVSRMREAWFTQTLRNIKGSKRMKATPLSTFVCFLRGR